MAEQQLKRNTAYKLRIGDLSRGKEIIENEKLSCIELDGKRIVRINIIANVIEKYETDLAPKEGVENPQSKKYLTLTIDDASGQIRLKSFGDDALKFLKINQGDTVLVIGTLRTFNNEVYIAPEIIKLYDPRYLLVRKLELEKNKPQAPIDKSQIKDIKDKVLEMIKSSEDGIDADKLIMEIKASPEAINQEIHKLLEEGIIYAPRPGRFRYLG